MDSFGKSNRKGIGRKEGKPKPQPSQFPMILDLIPDQS